MLSRGIAQKHVAVACSIALTIGGALVPRMSWADSSSEVERLRAEAQNMAQTIEDTTAAYQQAAADADLLERQIADNEARAAEINAKLPEQRERAARSIKELYLFQKSTPGLLELILSSEDFNQFITTLSYLDTIHSRNADQIKQLASLSDELDSTIIELNLQRDVAQQKKQEALEALDEARAARKWLQDRADAIAATEAAERAKAIAAARAAVKAASSSAAPEPVIIAPTQQTVQTQVTTTVTTTQTVQQQEAAASAQPEQQATAPEQPAQPEQTAQQEQAAPEQAAAPSVEESPATFTTNSGNTAPIEIPEEDVTSASTEPLTTNTTTSEVDVWAARIDAYLAGSPLAGYGATFANAAASYGVDPRLSPAISCIESSKGAICFLPHNAWGWGSSSWGSWESAIYDHVAGLASMYGGILTLEGAQMYCPPSYQEWYSSVLAEMSSI